MGTEEQPCDGGGRPYGDAAAGDAAPRDAAPGDEPLPGLADAGRGAPRDPHREDLPGSGRDGEPLVPGWQDWLDHLAWSRSRPPDPEDPYPLRGGERCDRCGALATYATEHRRSTAPAPLADLVRDDWATGTLLWCDQHLREHGLALLRSGAVVVGTRGDR